ncbi:MAG TPA: NADH-quinone oxidoreductase subunit M [Gemmatimonadaceae bacterium]|nr:NADH-quinone oxidoreductase subunit M [Gemmatimonadaceae bacterium]
MTDFLASTGYSGWILPALLALLVLGALVVWVHGIVTHSDDPAEQARAAQGARRITLAFFVAEFVLSVGLWWAFDPSTSAWQATVSVPWIDMWGSRFSVGIDGMSLMMVLLTTFTMPLAVLGGWTSVKTRVHAYHAMLLLLTVGMLGVFMALDLLFFYVMWELMLVPMYVIIGVWGGERRIYASVKFFIYTFLGSLLMLVAVVYLGIKAGDPVTGTPNFSYDAIISTVQHSPTAALWLFGAFFMAFAVKVPIFPFHTWLPDAHVEAPTAGSVVLAALMLKLGTFGFLRFAMPLFPGAAMDPAVRMTIITLAVIGVIYGSLVALVQPDFKKLVAYSSVAHLGMAVLGIFALTRESVQGAMMVMLSHGLSTGGLFLLIGMIYERRHTRLFSDYGGIAKVMPIYGTLLTVITLASIGLPGTSGFIAEFFVLIGAFKTVPWMTFVATIGVILGAAYMLWAIQRILYNPLDKRENEEMKDLNWREIGLMTPIIIAILWLGLYPRPILTRMEASTTRFVQQVEAGSSPSATAAVPGGR